MKTKFILPCLGIIAPLLLFSQEAPKHQNNSVTLGGYTASFTDINGYAVAVGYQYKLHRYITIEGNISHASGSSFPDYLEQQTETDPDSPTQWSTKTAVENIAANLHFSVINNKHHFLSAYAGLGYMSVASTDYIMTKSVVYNQGVISISSSYYLYAEKKSFASKNYGLQYKYSFNNGFQVGADIRGVSPLGKNSFLGQPNYLSAGILIGKKFK
ncbi:hypothetical protein [Flavobacterium psychrotrophum]|uniref:hypothetical protein n=1 Tax=Flavobacterium psychrotrophum TaxID=2294119 RepID=UPI000E30C1DB|nr:hypothetical protein [Flavobacterium psychrotrophum]